MRRNYIRDLAQELFMEKSMKAEEHKEKQPFHNQRVKRHMKKQVSTDLNGILR